MSHAYSATYTHCIFSTKDRNNTIPGECRANLWAYLIGIAQNLRIVPIAVGGTSNHAHLLLRVPPVMPLSEAMQKLKPTPLVGWPNNNPSNGSKVTRRLA